MALPWTYKLLLSRRVVTPQGIRPAAILVEGGQIKDVVPLEQVPRDAQVRDFGDAAILPGSGRFACPHQ